MQKLSDNCSQRGGSKNPATPPTTAHPITASVPSVDSVSDALILGAQKVQNYDLMEMIRIITLPPSIMCMWQPCIMQPDAWCRVHPTTTAFRMQSDGVHV